MSVVSVLVSASKIAFFWILSAFVSKFLKNELCNFLLKYKK